jgi:hypothetical protein
MIRSSDRDVVLHHCATDDLRHTHDPRTAKRLLTRVVPTQERRRAQDLIPSGMDPIGLTRQSVVTSVSAGHGPDLWAWLDLNQRPHLIRYRGLSAVRTGVSPDHWRASGAKGCVLSDLVPSGAGEPGRLTHYRPGAPAYLCRPLRSPGLLMAGDQARQGERSRSRAARPSADTPRTWPRPNANAICCRGRSRP